MGLEVLSSGFKVGLTGWGVVSQGVDAYVMMGGGGCRSASCSRSFVRIEGSHELKL